MYKTIRNTAAAAVLTAAVATPAMASTSPIFGKASVKPMTVTQAQQVKGKGTTSLYYGYYGIYYAQLAIYYGNISQYNNALGYGSGYTYYYTAYQYANSAASNFYYAYYYIINGY